MEFFTSSMAPFHSIELFLALVFYCNVIITSMRLYFHSRMAIYQSNCLRQNERRDHPRTTLSK